MRKRSLGAGSRAGCGFLQPGEASLDAAEGARDCGGAVSAAVSRLLPWRPVLARVDFAPIAILQSLIAFTLAAVTARTERTEQTGQRIGDQRASKHRRRRAFRRPQARPAERFSSTPSVWPPLLRPPSRSSGRFPAHCAKRDRSSAG